MDLTQVLDRLVAAAMTVLPADAAAVLLSQEGRLVVAAARGVKQEAVVPLLEPEATSEMVVEGPGDRLPPGFGAALGLPLEAEGLFLGLLQVYCAQPRSFAVADVARLRGLAQVGGGAVRAAQELADLERVETAKGPFIRIATHELRSPITVAQSLVRTVLKGYAGPLTDTQQDIFARVAARLDFLESLVDDLLDLAAGKAPELAEEEGPVLVNASVGRAALLLQPRAEEKGVALTVAVCREELVVWATEDGLDRVFVNLIGNAVKYTPEGGSVAISMGRAEAEVWVTVSDTGIGIPDEALPHLFTEFYRAPNARQFGVGTGLGLAIVKDLVDRYGGRIEVKSQVEEGTAFTVTLPVYISGDFVPFAGSKK